MDVFQIFKAMSDTEFIHGTAKLFEVYPKNVYLWLMYGMTFRTEDFLGMLHSQNIQYIWASQLIYVRWNK